jgi:uncharacterized membrane protein
VVGRGIEGLQHLAVSPRLSGYQYSSRRGDLVVLRKIISGGQTGADQGGLAAAKRLGLETGGLAPKGYRTENGSNPGLLKGVYGLEEAESPSYAARTAANVIAADGTVVFGDVASSGSRETIAVCRRVGKPYLKNPTPSEFEEWLIANQIRVLNVAGNRESKFYGLRQKVESFIVTSLSSAAISR